MSHDTDQIQIMGEPQMDPNVCKFTVDRPVYPEGSVRCTSAEMAEGSPLLERLFAIEGISQVLFFESSDPCDTSYADRQGKYQAQRGLTLPRV